MGMSQGGGGAAPATGRFAQGVKAVLTSAAVGLALAGPMLSLPGSAGASDKRVVGEISASGLVFKVSNTPHDGGVAASCQLFFYLPPRSLFTFSLDVCCVFSFFLFCQPCALTPFFTGQAQRGGLFGPEGQGSHALS